MKDILNKVYKRFPFMDSVVSLLFGAIISYLFQCLVDTWRSGGTASQKAVICLVFLVTLGIMSGYYRLFYSSAKRRSILEKEREKSEIQRLKSEREMISSLYKQGTKAMEKEDLSIIEKAEIVKQINTVIKDNKRSD
ncbi:hypothetical protein [Intestinimonas massiliensis (ex Afouda et al. 2020)]|uniref:hypothetical protein n=1 Tax=Intestinimonas massiliensis (ex Afouda et al. 2020) TaxID=1673721 RepID=UPI001031794E|nr:hypothetical protein [Intestinimonas massiliensis (ex Afouda et al. 2020)]